MIHRGGFMISLKRGDTFSINLQFEDAAHVAVQPDTVSCHLRDSELALIEVLTLTPTGETGEYTLSSPDTTAWPVEDLQMDLEVVVNGIIVSSSTQTVRVKQDITYV